jgi:hypothetical protein
MGDGHRPDQTRVHPRHGWLRVLASKGRGGGLTVAHLAHREGINSHLVDRFSEV